jgi:large subunit ribosomal protein L4
MKIAVRNLQNKEVGQLDLDESVFAAPVRKDVLLQMVNYQLAKRRAGTHKTKGISEVSGTGKKPWKQKGTGRARFGSLRAPQFRGGAIIFGPVVRSHATELPKRVRQLALRTALSVKASEGKLIVVDEAVAKTPKTKEMVRTLSAFDTESILLISGAEVDVNLVLATRNLPFVDVLPVAGANVYDILRRDTLLLTRDAVTALTERLKTA